MEFKINTIEVTGLGIALKAAGNAMRTEMDTDYDNLTEKDYKRGEVLGGTGTGEGHDNFLNGITVHFNMWAPLYMWKQIQRYHFIDFISSQSTMHKLTKFNIKDSCVADTDPIILNRYEELLQEYQKNNDPLLWRKLVASLPSGFVLGATMITNYRQLKTMYLQRKHHKLREWKEFCAWCETLPYFNQFTGVKDVNNN